MSTCSICFEPNSFLLGSSGLHCGHAYHTACIDQWFATSRVRACPTCRKVEPPPRLPCLFMIILYFLAVGQWIMSAMIYTYIALLAASIFL